MIADLIRYGFIQTKVFRIAFSVLAVVIKFSPPFYLYHIIFLVKLQLWVGCLQRYGIQADNAAALRWEPERGSATPGPNFILVRYRTYPL